MDKYYVIYLEDYSLPGFVDGYKKCFGTKDELLTFYINAKKKGISSLKLNALYAFVNDSKFQSILKYNDHMLGEKAIVLGSQNVSINDKKWTHINTWNLDYKMKVDKCDISVLWIRHRRKYYRCIKPIFTNLCYTGDPRNDYVPVKNFWGQPGYFSLEDETLSSSIYAIDKKFEDKQELLKDIENFEVDSINFTQVINEVFGDG